MTWNEHKEAKERHRFVTEGLDKRPPVIESAVLFLAMWLGGWGCSSLLHVCGMTSIPARYAISTLVSYGIFIWSVGVWCRQANRPGKPSSGPGLDLGFDLSWIDNEGCWIAIAILAAFLLLSGIFYFVGGYALLFEVAFEATFAGTMVYRMGRRDPLGHWAGTLVRRTWLPALIIAGLLVAVGAKLQHDHPEASTLAQAIKARRAGQR